MTRGESGAVQGDRWRAAPGYTVAGSGCSGSCQLVEAGQDGENVSDLSVMAAGWRQVDIDRCIIQAPYGVNGYAHDDEMEWLHVPEDWPMQRNVAPNGQQLPAAEASLGAGGILPAAVLREDMPGCAAVPQSSTEIEPSVGSEADAMDVPWVNVNSRCSSA